MINEQGKPADRERMWMARCAVSGGGLGGDGLHHTQLPASEPHPQGSTVATGAQPVLSDLPPKTTLQLQFR